MPGPTSYTDIGGGGDLKPHGEDFFNRITNVHWPKKRVVTSGVFIVGDNDSNISYLKFGPDSPSDPGTGDPIWQSLGTLDFLRDEGDSFTGWVQGSACGLIGSSPVFVLVGGGGNTAAVGIIMASSDGLNWSRVYTLPQAASDGARGANVFGVVWDGTQFWAGGHQSINRTDSEEGGDPHLYEVDILLRSSDGLSWSETGRAVNSLLATDPEAEWSLGDYVTGLLEPHCSDTVNDSNNNGVPGGVFGYDEDTKTLIAPVSPPALNYSSGGVFVGDGGGVVVTEVGKSTFPSDPGLPVHGVATAGGAWMAAGGDVFAPEGGTGQAALLVPSSTGEHGIAWKRVDPGGKAIVTICGGYVPTL